MMPNQLENKENADTSGPVVRLRTAVFALRFCVVLSVTLILLSFPCVVLVHGETLHPKIVDLIALLTVAMLLPFALFIIPMCIAIRNIRSVLREMEEFDHAE